MQKSLGLIETQGLCAGIVAADAAVKSANVQLIGYELTRGGGWTTIKVEGDVGAVKAAIDAASAAAGRVGRVVSTRVIARPSDALGCIIHSVGTVGDSAFVDSPKSQESDDFASFDTLPTGHEPENKPEEDSSLQESEDREPEETVSHEVLPQTQTDGEPDAPQDEQPDVSQGEEGIAPQEEPEHVQVADVMPKPEKNAGAAGKKARSTAPDDDTGSKKKQNNHKGKNRPSN